MNEITTITVWEADGNTVVNLTDAQVQTVKDFQTSAAIALQQRIRHYVAALEASGMSHGAADELVYEALGAIVENGTIDYLPRD